MSKAFRLIFGFILMIPAITFLLMIVFICIACSSHTIDRYTGEIDNEVPRRRIISRSRTPSEPTAVATCLDDSKIKSCSELIVLEMNENGSVVQGEKHSCSICLDEYSAKEKVRQINSCQHRFHADCVDHWFQKNSICPICRVSLLDEKL